MPILYIDTSLSGLSGDMMVAALYDMGVPAAQFQDLAEILQQNLEGTKILTINFEKVSCHGVPASYVDIQIDEHKHHRTIPTLEAALVATCESLGLSSQASQLGQDIFSCIVDAESRIHNIAPNQVHLHEIASVDTLFDSIGVAMGCYQLGLLGENSSCYASDVAVGGGIIQIAHGTVPVPAPATAEILQKAGLTLIGGPIDRELTTPTGAAILASLRVMQIGFLPRMKLHIIGHGAGKLAKAGIASPVTLYLGEVPLMQDGFEEVIMLETNLDDVTGEILGYVLDRAIAEGALDAYLTPVIMKKSRPGQVLHVLCNPGDASKLTQMIIGETGTLGVRQIKLNRLCMPRGTHWVKIQVNQNEHDVRVKYQEIAGGTPSNFKPEFEDLKKISQVEGIPVNYLAKLAIQEFLRVFNMENGG